MKVPRIEYILSYLLNGKTLSKLDMNICENMNFEIDIPIEIDRKDIDRYNYSCNYYKDICYTYTTENGTDIIINDRIEEYVNNDMNACEENCDFKNYDYENKKAKCSCKIKYYIKKFSEININKT